MKDRNILKLKTEDFESDSEKLINYLGKIDFYMKNLEQGKKYTANGDSCDQMLSNNLILARSIFEEIQKSMLAIALNIYEDNEVLTVENDSSSNFNIDYYEKKRIDLACELLLGTQGRNDIGNISNIVIRNCEMSATKLIQELKGIKE